MTELEEKKRRLHELDSEISRLDTEQMCIKILK